MSALEFWTRVNLALQQVRDFLTRSQVVPAINANLALPFATLEQSTMTSSLTKLVLSDSQANRLATAGSSAVKKGVWKDIRYFMQIPKTFRIGKDKDRALYVADTEPRQYLYGYDNRYSHVMVPPLEAVPVADPAQAQGFGEADPVTPDQKAAQDSVRKVVETAQAAAVTAPAEPAPTTEREAIEQVAKAIEAVAETKFSVSDSGPSVEEWRFTSRKDILAALRAGAAVHAPAKLPDGFPKGLGKDALVFDADSGVMFFRP